MQSLLRAPGRDRVADGPMTDPAPHALLQRELKKASPAKPTLLTLVHAQSRAEKQVEYLGMIGSPLRAQIHWPIAGQYEVAPRSGTILGPKKNSEALRHWKISPEGHEFLKQEYRAARARIPQRPPRMKGLAKCP